MSCSYQIQSPTNDTSPGKELIEWKNGFLSTAIENGGVVVLDALDQASATVTERLNGLLEQNMMIQKKQNLMFLKILKNLKLSFINIQIDIHYRYK